MIPKGGGRPWVQFYEEKKASDWQDVVAAEARKQLLATPTQGDGEDFLLPLREYRILMSVRFNLRKPASYPKRIVHHTKKPDVDNLVKAVLDGLVKGGVMEDDNLITDLAVMKRYLEPGHPEGVEIDLTALPVEVP